jgi:hypothetical protein
MSLFDVSFGPLLNGHSGWRHVIAPVAPRGLVGALTGFPALAVFLHLFAVDFGANDMA